MLPKVSIIVICYNFLEQTKECIRVLSKNIDIPFELILVSNGSTDGTEEWSNMLCEPILKQNSNFIKYTCLNFKNNRYWSYACNAGILHTSAKYISVIANDILMPPKYFSWAIENLEKNPQIGSISPSHTEDPRFQGAENYINNYDKIPKKDEWTPGWHNAVCQTFTREMWEKVGEWEERLKTHCQDNDHGLRIRICGYEPTSYKGIVAYHHYGSLARKSLVKEPKISLQDARYFHKKYKIYSNQKFEEIPSYIIEFAEKGNYISSGQKRNIVKY
jgi:GT2 family glycosyltransferase